MRLYLAFRVFSESRYDIQTSNHSHPRMTIKRFMNTTASVQQKHIAAIVGLAIIDIKQNEATNAHLANTLKYVDIILSFRCRN